MSKQKWFSGPPPSIGWWPASVAKDQRALRWWDGVWSAAAYEGNSADTVARMARTPSYVGPVGSIRWTHRPKSWPKRSRT